METKTTTIDGHRTMPSILGRLFGQGEQKTDLNLCEPCVLDNKADVPTSTPVVKEDRGGSDKPPIAKPQTMKKTNQTLITNREGGIRVNYRKESNDTSTTHHTLYEGTKTDVQEKRLYEHRINETIVRTDPFEVLNTVLKGSFKCAGDITEGAGQLIAGVPAMYSETNKTLQMLISPIVSWDAAKVLEFMNFVHEKGIVFGFNFFIMMTLIAFALLFFVKILTEQSIWPV